MAVKAPSPNQWTARDFPAILKLRCNIYTAKYTNLDYKVLINIYREREREGGREIDIDREIDRIHVVTPR